MDFIVKILETRQVTHNVKRFRLEKPSGYSFVPGQATDVSINQPRWEGQKRPFTFTCLNTDPFLEFTIKRYPDDHGVTDMLHQLEKGDELIVRDVWGAITYKGPGYFIAGGAGITPFLAILRQLHKDDDIRYNILFFSNKIGEDIIEEQELTEILGKNARFVLTQEDKNGYEHTHIDDAFLRQHVNNFHRPFYICGPDPMIQEISATLTTLGAVPEALVFEK